MKIRTFSPIQRRSRIKPKLPSGSVGRAALLRSTVPARRPSVSGFTLIETIVATLLAAIMLPTLFACLAAGFSIVQVTRENLRATQVIVQRMEAVRLAPYKTLQDNAAYPSSYTEYYCPSGQTNGGPGTVYAINYKWTPGPTSLPPSYRTNVLLITVTASWNSAYGQHTRSMQSYVARYGIQRYVCGS